MFSDQVSLSLAQLSPSLLLSFSSRLVTLITGLLAKIGFTLVGEDVAGLVVARDAFGEGIAVDEIFGGG